MKLRFSSLIPGLLVTATLLAGCGSDATGSDGGSSITGRYTLQQIDGRPLPFSHSSSTTQSSGTLTLRADETWSATSAYRGGFDDGSVTATGIYDREGNTVSFLTSSVDNVLGGSSGSFTGTVSGNTLTISASSRVGSTRRTYTYRR